MRLSHQRKFVFLAYPRTASSTIRSLLDEISEVKGVHLSDTTPEFPFHHHISARELKRVFDRHGWNWFQYKRFCVVRNPYTRLVSLFNRRREKESLWNPRIRLKGNLFNRLICRLPARPAFNLFVLTRNPRQGVARNLQSFIGDATGNVLVEDILQFEHLKEQLPEYLHGLGVEISADDIPKLNASSSQTSYVELYTDLTRRKVEQMYQYEIKRFGYKFGD